MSIKDVGPEEARRLLNAGECVYLDVRTAAEFHAGHAPGAIHAAVAVVNPATGRMELNPHFASEVAAKVSMETALLVGCRSGQRSAAAIEILSREGYRNLMNLCGGFAGVVDPTGQVLQEGWCTLGFPVERGPEKGRGADPRGGQDV